MVFPSKWRSGTGQPYGLRYQPGTKIAFIRTRFARNVQGSPGTRVKSGAYAGTILPVRTSTLDLFTDASVEGESWVRERDGNSVAVRRSRFGPAMAAWIGWHDRDRSGRPTVAGMAYVREQGTQSAEYQAAIHGLRAALSYVDVTLLPPARLVLHVDNRTVAKQLNGEMRVERMKRYHQTAKKIIKQLEQHGVVVVVEKVTESHSNHKKAHRMSRQAWNQVFIDKSWAPRKPPKPKIDRPTPPPASSTGEGDIPF